MRKYSLPAELPVILITYNRPQHTAEVLKSLRLHGVSNLRIYSDAPRSPDHHQAVQQVRALFDEINWTTPQIVFQETNQGLAKSIRSAVDATFCDEEFLVLLEDDCVPERHFFAFMFECYKRYAVDPKIFGISGYTVSNPEECLSGYPYDIYFSPRIGSWGWGTWKNKWQLHHRNLEQLIAMCAEQQVDLNQGGSDVPDLIRMCYQGQVKDIWTLHWILSVYLHKGFYVYPTISHIRNIGMDGSGVHCSANTTFDTEIATKRPTKFPENIVVNRAFYNNFRSYYDLPGSETPDAAFNRLLEHSSSDVR